MNKHKLINMSLSDIQPHARSVSSNHLLNRWARTPESFNFERYNVCALNIAYYLSHKSHRIHHCYRVLKQHAHDTTLNTIMEIFAEDVAEQPKGGRFDPTLQQQFVDTCHLYALGVFGQRLTQQPLVCSSTAFYQSASKLFQTSVYTMLGAHTAQETQTPLQLKQLLKGYHKQRHQLADHQWAALNEFYDEHLSSADNALFSHRCATLKLALDDDAKKYQFFRGYEQYLALQNRFWQSLSDTVFTLDVA